MIFFPLCSGCNLGSQCCNTYEYCVSCCLNPIRVIICFIYFSFPFSHNHILAAYNLLNFGKIQQLVSSVSNLLMQTPKKTVLKLRIAKPETAGDFVKAQFGLVFGVLYFLFINSSEWRVEVTPIHGIWIMGLESKFRNRLIYFFWNTHSYTITTQSR